MTTTATPPEVNQGHGRNGHTPDEPTTWEPVDLGPYLRGERQSAQPAVGVHRTDGQQVLYAAREHAVLGETESGKTWFALACVASELAKGHDVVYVHFEESDPGSTIERLRILGAAAEDIAAHLRFVAPTRPLKRGWLDELLTPVPTLVVLDGINEAMSLQGADIMAADGASVFRRLVVKPFLAVGAAVLSCDHLPHNRDGQSKSRAAYGSVHKGNALDGARIVLENRHPFGIGLRGVSHVFITKDRPGTLRAGGKPTGVPGKTFVGTLVVDAQADSINYGLRFVAPTHDEDDENDDRPPADKVNVTSAELADIVYHVIDALPDHTVGSQRKLYAEMRQAGQAFRENAIRSAADDLLVTGRLREVPGKRGSTGFQTISTAAQKASS